MRNATGSCCCSRVAALHAQVLGSPASPHGYGGAGDGCLLPPPPSACSIEEMLALTTPAAPSLLRALVSLNILLLLAYLLLFLLAKFAARLHRRDHGREHRATETSEREEFACTDIAGEQQQQAGMLFWFDEAVFEDSALLGDEGKDQLLYTATPARCLQVESTFPTEESTRRISPHQRQYSFSQEEPKDVVAATAAAGPTVLQDIPAAAASPENVDVDQEKRSNGEEDGHEEEDDEEEKRLTGDDVKLFVNSRALADTKKLLLEGAVAAKGGGGGGGAKREREREDDKDSRLGASTLTSESTSKSSVEWRSSTVTKDSETEYPFSSSSRRSSSRWESYTLFRKYDEDMVYFHRVGAQKLTETESFRSIKHQPRSVSERIVQKLTPKPRAPIGLRDPYPELERVYVAQICLTWEALNWNYASFRRHGGDIAARCCPARVAQEFQQFQVLLHRFIENEPYEYGRRPEVYARMKNSSPKLLLVPEFRDEEDEKDDLISAVQFLYILEESIRTFMAFLRADKRSHYQMFREMVKRRTSSIDQSLVITLKKANKKKKSRLKDLTRPRRCLRRTKLRVEEEMSILLGLIDLKVVARVLRMSEITDQQLHWCEEKMNRVRVDLAQGKMQRDPSPLFFPAH
ncbi:hypothetical protein E2562_023571 [Oryza meyeriana var. granulata]|uniref:Uncharacterized protein n=1 Tax=Oryza meyeriana var. granulata TaxID=110450 RepID=A0A6G1E1Z2_9ORYZ|nr:hypothetical protein E2562_023571 [Oryza meyeriana var. granulata]